jgi:hypothetical protein
MADKITEIVGQEAFDQIEKLKLELSLLSEKFEKSARVALLMNTALSNSKGIKETSNAIKEQQTSLSEIEKLQAKFIHQTTETARVETELRLEIKRLTDANIEYVKSEKAKEGSINSLKSQLKTLQTEYNALSKAERDSSSGTEMLKKLKELKLEIKGVTQVKTEFIQTDLQLKQAEESLANSLRTSTTAINEKQKAELEAQMSARELANANDTAIKSNEKTSKSIDDLRRQKLGEKLETQERLKAEKQVIDVQNASSNSVERARKENILLKAERDSINVSTIASVKRVAELNKKIDENTAFIKFNGDTAQKQAMNIGNYESALRNMGKSATKAFTLLRNLAYIIPGLGISGIVGLAVEGVVMLADSMGILSKKTEEEIAKSKMFAEVQNEMISSIAKELSSLDVLYQTATNVNVSYKERGEAVDELQKLYPDMFNNANREKLLNGELADSYNILTSAIFKRAEETAKMNLLNKAILERTELQLKYENLTKQNAEGEFYYNQQNAEQIKNQIAGKDRQIKQIEQSIQKSKEGFKNDLYFIDEKTKKEYDAQVALDKKRAIEGKPKKERTEPRAKSETEVNRINEIKKQYEREQKELEISFKDRIITEEEFYYQSIQKATKFIAKRIGLSKKEHETEIDFNIDLKAKAQDFHDKLINNSLKELQVAQYVYGTEEEIVKAKQDAIKKKYKETYDSLNEQQKKNQKLLEDIQEKQKKKLEEYYAIQKAKQELTDQSIEASAEIASTITDRLIYNAERLAEIELKRVDAQEQAELASLDRLTLTENERAEKKKQIELEAEARRKAIEKEKIKDLRKFALIQKSIDVAQIISSTALSIMRALGEVGVPAPVKVANAIGFGLTGAVQLAKVLATPLPQYAEGIESTPTDSFAIVGEKGTELITEKSGKQYLTPNKDTLTYLPKGTKVTPHHELMANVYDNAHKYMASNSSVTTDTMQTALIQSFEELYNKVDNLTEIMAKKNMNVSIFGDFEHAMRIKKSRM